MVLAMTHEEIVTTHIAQVVRSYRDLPQILYHFQIKERDEPRPRAGVLRTREFIMKDSYTFDRDARGPRRRLREAPRGLRQDLRPLRAGVVPGRLRRRDDGRHRRARVHGALPGGRERRRAGPGLRRQRRGRQRDAEAGRAAPGAGRAGRGVRRRADDGRAGRRGARRARRRADQGLSGDRRRGRAAARARARRPPRQRHQARQRARRAFRPAHEAEFADRIGPAGYIGPVGTDVPILLDSALDGDCYISGANKADAHLRGVKPGRDFAFTEVDVRTVEAGRHRRRPRDPDRAGDRDRQHLQARHALLGAARRDLPGRVGHGAAGLDGLLRHRPGAHRGRRGRAVRRREGHLLAALAGAVRRAPGRARQARHRGVRAGREALRGAARARAGRHLRRPQPRARRASSPTPSCSACRCG